MLAAKPWLDDKNQYISFYKCFNIAFVLHQCLMSWLTGAKTDQLKAPKVPETDLLGQKLAATPTSFTPLRWSELSGDCWDSLRLPPPMTLIRDNQWLTEKWTDIWMDRYLPVQK